MKSSEAIQFYRPLLIALLLSAATLHAANDDVRLSATLVTGTIYPPGRWLPIVARLTNLSAAEIDGTVSIDAGRTATLLPVERAVRVPAHSTVSVELLTLLPDVEIHPKQKKAADLANVTWRDASGRPVVSEPLGGLSDSSVRRDGHDATGLPGVALLAVSGDITDDRLDTTELASQLSTRVDYGFDPVTTDVTNFPRHVDGLDAARLIAVDPAGLEKFDAAQRSALLSAVRGGTTLLLVRPDASAARSWLGPYLPMDFIGLHRAAALHPKGLDALPLHAAVKIGDFVARDGATVLAADDRGPLAAYLPLGLGRVVMTAFEVNDLTSTPASAKLWADLIGIERTAFHDPVALAGKPPVAALLPAMIGATAPPWHVAAAVVGGYVALVSLLLLAAGQGRRPTAMAGCVGVSVLLTGGLLGFTAAKSRNAPLMIGRVSLLDTGGTSATQNDLVTFFGQQRDDLAIDLPAGATVTPVTSNGQATLTLWPSRINRIGASPGKLETVWQIRRTFDIAALSATVRFGPGGATLATHNTLDQPLQSPRLIEYGNVIPMPTIAVGKTEQPIGPRNAPGVFSDSAKILADEQSKLRAQFVQLVTTGAVAKNLFAAMTQKTVPVLSGFITDDANLHIAEPAESHAQTLVRVPLSIDAAPPGSDVRIDPPFVVVQAGIAQAMPYSQTLGAWNETNLTGSYLFALAAPRQAGRLRPRMLKLAMDARASGYHIVLRRAQCTGGKLKENASGAIAAEWNGASSPVDINLDLADTDIDANGWVWLRLAVDPIASTGPMGDGVAGNWQLTRFDPALIGTIDAPPQTEIITWPLPETIKPAVRPAQPKKTTLKPKPATNPVSMPATK